MHVNLSLLFALAFGFVAASAPGGVAAAASADDQVIAIDVLLEPDQTMIDAANMLNVRLRGNYPKGYELDALHAPHVTLLQRFVRQGDFDTVTAAVGRVLATEHPTEARMQATGLDYVIWGGVAVTAVTVERSPELLRLHQRVVDAVQPYSVDVGTAAAFVGSDANDETIAWVAGFVPKSSGSAYMPHVTVGVATEAFAKQLKAEPFQPFSFKARGVAIYQLGNFGTAARKLWPR